MFHKKISIKSVLQTFERPKQSCRVFLSPRQVQSYRKCKKVKANEKKIKKYNELYKEEKQ